MAGEAGRWGNRLSLIPCLSLGVRSKTVPGFPRNCAAEHYVALRRLGATVRKAIDGLIAAWCIQHGVPLLHADRDFLPFARHRGLVTA